MIICRICLNTPSILGPLYLGRRMRQVCLQKSCYKLERAASVKLMSGTVLFHRKCEDAFCTLIKSQAFSCLLQSQIINIRLQEENTILRKSQLPNFFKQEVQVSRSSLFSICNLQQSKFPSSLLHFIADALTSSLLFLSTSLHVK